MGLLIITLWGCRPPDAPTEEPPTDFRQAFWVQISAQACALDRNGLVTCWSDGSEELPAIPSNPAPVSVFHANRSYHVWGIGLDGFPVDWHCGFESNPPATCSVPIHEFSQIGSGNALDLHGVLGDWGSGGPVFLPFGQQRQTLFAPLEDAVIVLNEQNVAQLFSDKFLPIYTYVFDSERTYVELAPYGAAACVLDEEGFIECQGEPWAPNILGVALPTFDNPPYIALRGESAATCAQRSDHVIECHDGQTYDFGPLRDFDVTTDRDVLPAGPSPGYVPGTDPYSLCVITVDDAIECVGDRYSQEVLDQLPTGPLE